MRWSWTAWRRGGQALTGGIALLLLSASAAGGQGGPGPLLAPTPLILKDGRIAAVSVHVLPFAPGSSRLGDSGAATLGDLTRAVPLECFLTAQVIGHVGRAEVTERDTLGAHRLARARAEAVQSSLIEGGLPAAAIASVWDWQFLVRDARATLWVFRLTEGEACEAASPAGEAPALVARRDPAPEPRPRPRPEVPSQAAAGSPAAQPAIEADRRATRPEQPEEPQGAEAPEQPATRQAGPAPVQTEVPTVTGPLPAVSRATESPQRTAPARTEEPARPSPDATRTAVARGERPAEREVPAEAGAGPVVITFATNSSYFPPGTAERLRVLLDDLPREGPFRVEIEASVSDSDRVIGAETREEAARYNRWLAERRLERVESWFDEQTGGRDLVIEPSFKEKDDSRQVRVRILPAG